MKDYEIVPIKDDNDISFFCVYENQTENVVGIYPSREEAKQRLIFLDRGGAFSGFTPGFILNGVDCGSLDERFTRALKL